MIKLISQHIVEFILLLIFIIFFLFNIFCQHISPNFLNPSQRRSIYCEYCQPKELSRKGNMNVKITFQSFGHFFNTTILPAEFFSFNTLENYIKYYYYSINPLFQQDYKTTPIIELISSNPERPGIYYYHVYYLNEENPIHPFFEPKSEYSRIFINDFINQNANINSKFLNLLYKKYSH